ncbi:TPA: cell surface protein, partial [Streptococcus agalactiae]|nr:cell surface protein [Streptococcus agalactiae]
MKTRLKKNNKFWTVALAVIVSISCILGLWTVVYAQEQKSEAPTKNEAVQTEVEVNVRYIFEDEKVFKEEKIKAEKGQLIDSGDLPMLPDDMKFIDEFLFYEVKGDGKDEIIRKVAKIEVKAEETQTELSKDDISKIEKEAKELQDKLDKLNSELKDKDKLSDKQKNKIKDLEDEIDSLKEKMKKDKGNKDLSEDMKKEIDKLTEKVKELEKKATETNKAPVTSQSVTPISPISGIKTSSGISNQTPVSNNGKGTSETTSSGTVTKDTANAETKEKEIRYPNKLTAKAPANNSQDSSMGSASKSV